MLLCNPTASRSVGRDGSVQKDHLCLRGSKVKPRPAAHSADFICWLTLAWNISLEVPDADVNLAFKAARIRTLNLESGEV